MARVDWRRRSRGNLRALALAFGAAMGSMPSALMAQEVLSVSYEKAPQAAQVLGLADLDKLRQLEFETSTPWTHGIKTFSGPPLSEVLASAGIRAERFRLVALNDYSAEIRMDEMGTDYPIVATRIDGQIIPVRTNGPFWIIFPYDAGAEYRTEMPLSQSVWQLVSILAMQN